VEKRKIIEFLEKEKEEVGKEREKAKRLQISNLYFCLLDFVL
jgi:hypothetical protein